MRAGRIDAVTEVTVATYLEQWLAGKANLRPSTRRSYRLHIDRRLIPHLGHIRLTSLRAVSIDRMISDLQTGPEPLGVASTRRVFATLRVALNKAVRQGYIAVNPCQAVELPSEFEHRAPAQPWTPEEVRRFLTAVADHRLAPMYLMAITTGMRRGEIIGLRWSDVDLDNGHAQVRRTVLQLGGQIVAGHPKTKRSVRVVPLDRTTVEALRDHRRQQHTEREQAGDCWADHEGRIFTRTDGSGLVPEHVSRQFKALASRAGLPVIRFHDLRHTTASLALAGGVPLRVVSERLGHSSIAITSDLYTNVYDSVGRDAAERIARAIVGPMSSPVDDPPGR